MTTEYFDNSSSILSSTEKCDILPQTTDGGEPSKPSKQTPGFDFHAQHNNAACIHNLDPKVKGTPSEFWHTISMYVGLFHESQKTIQNNIDSLFSNGELVERKNLLTTVVIEDSLGRGHSVVIYNLEVLNKLAMLCFKGNPYAQEIRNKFSDILTAYETGVSVDPAPSVPDFTKLTRREILQMALDAEIAKEEAEKKLALSCQELDDEKEDHRHDNCVKNGKCGGITKNRNHYKTKSETLAVENEELKDAVGRGSNWRTVSMMKSEWVREFGHAPVWQKLKQFSTDVGIDPRRDVEEKVVLPDGREKVHLSFRYHREAWARYRKYEENLRVTDKEIENV